MANANPVKYDIPLALRVDQAFIDAADAVRRTRSPIPSRSDIVREAMLAYAKSEVKAPKKAPG